MSKARARSMLQPKRRGMRAENVPAVTASTQHRRMVRNYRYNSMLTRSGASGSAPRVAFNNSCRKLFHDTRQRASFSCMPAQVSKNAYAACKSSSQQTVKILPSVFVSHPPNNISSAWRGARQTAWLRAAETKPRCVCMAWCYMCTVAAARANRTRAYRMNRQQAPPSETRKHQ